MTQNGPAAPSGTAGSEAGGPLADARRSASSGTPDVVFDFSGLAQMRVQDLSVLLTARQVAIDDDLTVWAAGVPPRTWHILSRMGLSSFFRPFPAADVQEA